jgi:hypothetical protein
MRLRGRRLLIGLGLVFLAGVVLLALLEWGRRRQVEAAGVSRLDGSGMAVAATELEKRYRDSEALARLCTDFTQRLDDLQGRALGLWHTRKTRLIRYDSTGQAEGITETTFHVHFEDGAERKREVARRQLLGKPSFFDLDKLKLELADLRLLLPFSKESPEGLYRYRLAGVEEIDGRRALRIQFEPTEPVERSFRGAAWIDAASGEPVRLLGSPVKPRLRVDRFEMLFDYGPSENGFTQLRRVVIETAGGFALVSWHFRSETELSDYRAAD